MRNDIEVRNAVTPVPVENSFHVEQGGTAIGVNQGTVNYNGVDPSLLHNLFGELAELKRALGGRSEEQSHAIEWAEMNKERYCLFVLENEKYNTGAFCIPLKKALKYTDDFTRSGLIGLTSADREMIKSMPCIFAMRNKHFKRTDDCFPFMVGKITEIEIQCDNIKFSFTAFQPPFQQNILNDNIKKLGLRESTCRNQLDEAHWAVINKNLIEIGREIGIEVI